MYLGSEIWEKRTYLGSDILRTEKKYLGSKIGRLVNILDFEG